MKKMKCCEYGPCISNHLIDFRWLCSVQFTPRVLSVKLIIKYSLVIVVGFGFDLIFILFLDSSYHFIYICSHICSSNIFNNICCNNICLTTFFTTFVQTTFVLTTLVLITLVLTTFVLTTFV